MLKVESTAATSLANAAWGSLANYNTYSRRSLGCIVMAAETFFFFLMSIVFRIRNNLN